MPAACLTAVRVGRLPNDSKDAFALGVKTLLNSELQEEGEMGNIYLVGFMGTGKSAVGRELAKIKQWRFIDLDELIEKKAEKSIADIFAQKGEPYFRDLEKMTLNEIAAGKDSVVACGGGIVIDRENIATMKHQGVVICLKASAEVILKRTSGKTHRPLLNVADPKKQIESLLQSRAADYAQADKSIETSTLSLKEIVQNILEFLDQNKSQNKTEK
ncbi:MAG: shikimate kinase [Candidatus Omnitrophota bacterium]